MFAACSSPQDLGPHQLCPDSGALWPWLVPTADMDELIQKHVLTYDSLCFLHFK